MVREESWGLVSKAEVSTLVSRKKSLADIEGRAILHENSWCAKNGTQEYALFGGVSSRPNGSRPDG